MTVNLKIWTIKTNDILGLEEVMLKSEYRYTTVKWISKKARMIKISAESLFVRLKSEDSINYLMNLALK